MAVSNNVFNQPREWITPEEQLSRLSQPLVSRIAEAKIFPNGIADIISVYAIPSEWSNWHTALKRMNMLPDSIPALPLHITQILNSKCPIYNGQKSLKESGVLYLKPPGSLIELELKAYRSCDQMFKQNPFTVSFAMPGDFNEMGLYRNLRSDAFEWVWLSKDILPGSKNESFKTQATRVAELSKKALVTYEVPTLMDVITVCFLHMAATGERLYPYDHEFSYMIGDEVGPHTRVQEKILGEHHLTVGGFRRTGLCVATDKCQHLSLKFKNVSLGMSVVRRF